MSSAGEAEYVCGCVGPTSHRACPLDGWFGLQCSDGSPGCTGPPDFQSAVVGSVVSVPLELTARRARSQDSKRVRQLSPVHLRPPPELSALRTGPPQLPTSSPLTGSPCVPDFLAGIPVTNERLDLMRLRYSDSTGRVSFPSLVCVLMRLEAMTGVIPGPSWRPSQRTQEGTRNALQPQAWARPKGQSQR